MADDFVHLHTHTMYSAFDGLGTPQEFARRAAAMGQRRIAFTDHGTVRGLYDAHKACDEHGLALIPGAELYLADDAIRHGLTPEEKRDIQSKVANKQEAKRELAAATKRLQDRDHITVWALNETGLVNLYRLTTWAWTHGFYGKPRVDFKRLKEYRAGLAVSSGCAGGVVAAHVLAGHVERARQRAEELAEMFGDRFVVEVMPHIPKERPGGDHLAATMVNLARSVGAPIVATQDAHYPVAKDAHAQDVLLCVNTRSKMDESERFRFDSYSYWLRSREEMATAFATVPGMEKRSVEEALDGTMAFADRVVPSFRTVAPGTYLVAPELPPGFVTYDEWLYALCRDGAVTRYGVPLYGVGAGVRERLLHELRTIRDLGFAAYFCAVRDVVDWARGRGILVGPGRGSAAGSLVSYLLRITDVDPLHHGLLFERFMSPGRTTDLPDIDTDVEAARRDEVLDYLRKRYGEDRVAHISTHNMLGGRSTLRDLVRVYDRKGTEIAPLIGVIPQTVGPDAEEHNALSQALRETEVGRVFAEQHPDIAEVAERLEGQMRSAGLHAAGIVVASRPLTDIVPLETRPRKGGGRIPAIAFDMHGVEAAGLVKLDVLGLHTLTMLRRAFELSGAKSEDFDLEAPDVLEGFTRGHFVGVFQFDSPSSRKLCRGFEFHRFADVAAMTALNRPGPMKTGMADLFKQRHADSSKIEPLHPVYDRVMAETYGVPIYQEQVITLARDLGGYTPEGADKLRKLIAKKLPGLAAEEDTFVAGAVAHGMDEDAAKGVFKSLVGFGGYGFNKCLDENELVLAEAGAKPIRAVEVGERVWTSAGLRKVVRHAMTIRAAYEVQLVDGRTTVASADHRLFRPDGSAVRVVDLRKGDCLGVFADMQCAGVPQLRPLRRTTMLHTPQPEVAVGTNLSRRSTTSMGFLEQRQDEGDGQAVGGDSGSSLGRKELAVQGWPHGKDHDTSCVRDLPRMRVEESQDRGASPGSGSRKQCLGEPGSTLPIMPQEGPLPASWAQPQRGCRRRHGTDGVEQGIDQENGRAGGSNRSVEGRPQARTRNKGLAGSRVVSIRYIGTRRMIDIEVEHPHNFFLANGILSHNSHSVSYACLSVWMMTLKVRYPLAFYGAALEAEQNEQAQMRLAAEARRAGIPIRPPTVQATSPGFVVVEEDDGSVIVGPVDSLKGIGPAAAAQIRAGAPYVDLVDFRRRVSDARGVTVRTFEKLAQATALRGLTTAPSRFLVVNAKEVWHRLKRGETPLLETTPALDWRGDERTLAISEVWPLYSNAGRTALGIMQARLEAVVRRPIVLPGDPALSEPGVKAVIVFGRVAASKLFSSSGGQTARIALVSDEGGELSLRADADVVDHYAAAFHKPGLLMLGLARISERGAATLECAYPAEAALGSVEDPILGALITPDRTRPRDPGAAFRSARDRLLREKTDKTTFAVTGRVVRVRIHDDKKKQSMATIGLLGETGFLRFFVFASRWNKKAQNSLVLGRLVTVRLVCLGHDLATLGEHEIEVPDVEPRLPAG